MKTVFVITKSEQGLYQPSSTVVAVRGSKKSAETKVKELNAPAPYCNPYSIKEVEFEE